MKTGTLRRRWNDDNDDDEDKWRMAEAISKGSLQIRRWDEYGRDLWNHDDDHDDDGNDDSDDNDDDDNDDDDDGYTTM